MLYVYLCFCEQVIKYTVEGGDKGMPGLCVACEVCLMLPEVLPVNCTGGVPV